MRSINGGFYVLMSYCCLVYSFYNMALVMLKRKQMEILARWIRAAEEKKTDDMFSGLDRFLKDREENSGE